MPDKVQQRANVEVKPGKVVSKKETAALNNTPKYLGKSKKRKRDGSHADLTNGDVEQSKYSKLPDLTPKKPNHESYRGQGSPNNVSTLSQSNHHSSRRHPNPGPVLPDAANPSRNALQERAKALWPVRKTLPIWSHSLEIRSALRENDVLLLVGETGSGKSTQVPQILLRESWCQPRTCRVSTKFGTQNIRLGGCIAVTEPRRVAAISLARRVAEEMCSPLGSNSPVSQVGYSVRFDNSTNANTRIKFLTEGMLLQEILRDPFLREYSAVVVDEVHERGVNVDLVLGFLRRMLGRQGEGRGGVGLKVCVMSATVEMERLSRFFGEPREENEKGATEGAGNGVDGSQDSGMSGVTIKDDAHEDRGKSLNGGQHIENADSKRTDVESEVEGEEGSEWSGISTSGDEDVQETMQERQSEVGTQPNGLKEAPEKSILSRSEQGNMVSLKGHGSRLFDSSSTKERILPGVVNCNIEGRQFPVTINYVPQPVQDIVEASLKTVFQIHYKEPLPGDILVFLTGQETVESLESLVKEYQLGMSPEVPKLLVLPLFAALPQAAQQRVFQPGPPKTRKVIISTNIAETSVTVSGVRFVIDCGKAKIKHFRSRIGLESLLVKPISKSAAIQRKGRAGREAPGKCYRLYTEKDYLSLDASITPEILRCDLSHPILTMRARGVEDVINFPFLDKPPREAMEKALLHLWMLGALTDSGSVSEIGSQIARFPLSVSLGRALIAAAEPDAACVEEAIDIIACLSVENAFLNLNSEEKREQAETARRELYKREGDHLTLLATVQAFAAEGSDRKVWADRHFVSHRAMRAVMDVRKQLRAMCQQMGILSKAVAEIGASTAVSSETSVQILRSFLKGFAMNTAVLCPDGSYKTFVGKQTVAIHPSSVLFGRKVEAIMFNEFVFTKKSYARGVSAVQLDWIRERFPIE